MTEIDPASLTTVNASEYASRVRALLGKGGVSVGFPRKTVDRRILLHAVARGFREGERLTEIQATQRIGAFLTQFAPHWRMDRVSIRRELVDEGFLDRETNGTDYRVSSRYRERVRFEDAPDVAEILGPS
jgi:hypothetical protein